MFQRSPSHMGLTYYLKQLDPRGTEKGFSRCYDVARNPSSEPRFHSCSVYWLLTPPAEIRPHQIVLCQKGLPILRLFPLLHQGPIRFHE